MPKVFDRMTSAWRFASPGRVVRQVRHRLPALLAAVMLLAPTLPRLSGVAAGGPNTWMATGRMLTPLTRATAALLPDGKVLVVGVCGGAGCATGQLYDPRTGTWSANGPVTPTFDLATATLLHSDLVLVAGGCSDRAVAAGCHIADLYNPRTRTWAAASPMNSAHGHPTATLLADGKVLVAGGQDEHGDATAAAELYDPRTNQWAATDDMAMPRAGHTATLLPDGRVLVAGGDANNAGVLASAELFDQHTGTWAPTDAMTVDRANHTATLLPDGHVLVAGGEDASGARLDSAELFDPRTGTWAPTDAMTVDRANHTAALLPTGQVLVAGGNCELFQCDSGPPSHDAPLASAELYDPATGQWTLTGSLMTARSGHTATVLATGQVLVAGGIAIKGPPADAELYTPGASSLVSLAPRGVAFGTRVVGSGGATEAVTVTNAGASPLAVTAVGLSSTTPGAFTTADTCRGTPIAPRESCAITLHFTPTATGDYSATLLLTDTAPGSPQSVSLSGTGIPASRPDTWAPAGHMADARSGHTATLLPDGRVLVAAASGAGTRYLSSAELFDPQAGRWTVTGRLLGNPERNMGTTATLLPTGQVLVAGSIVFPNAQLYTPSTGRWTPTGTMSTDRFGDTATLLRDGRVLVAGGCGDICGLRADAGLYDPHTGRWTPTGSMATARMDHTATLLQNGDVLVAGGCNSCAPLSGAEVYHQRAGTWTTTGDLHTARYNHTATLLPDGQVLVAGGEGTIGSIGSQPLSSAELYNPRTGGWTITSSMRDARYDHTATLLPDGRVLVTGGCCEHRTGQVLSSAEVYDERSGRWTAAARMTTGRQRHTATLLPDGQVLMAGGCGGNGDICGALDSAEIYTPALTHLPLGIHVPDRIALSRGPLAIVLDTAPNAHVTIAVEVQGAHATVLDLARLQGTADAYGHFSGTLRSAYVPAHPVRVAVAVTTRLAQAAATQTVVVTLMH